MTIELSEKVSEEMFVVDCKRGGISAIDVVRKSKSGDTVQTASGCRYRTDTKRHKIFNSYDFALICRKQILEEFDEEYESLLHRNGLRRISAPA